MSIAAQAETTPSSIPVSPNAPQGRFAIPITLSPLEGPARTPPFALSLSKPVLRALEGPVLRALEGPVLRALEGPVLRALEGPVLRAHEGGTLATLTRTPRANANAPATLPSWNTHARIWNSTSPPLSRRGARRTHSPSPGSCGCGPRQRGVVAPLQKNLGFIAEMRQASYKSNAKTTPPTGHSRDTTSRRPSARRAGEQPGHATAQVGLKRKARQSGKGRPVGTSCGEIGGRHRTRTYDPLRVKQVL